MPFRPVAQNSLVAMRKDVSVSTDASPVVAEPGQPARLAQPAQVAEPAEPQAVVAPLTKAAIFLVAVVNPDPDSAAAAVSLCGDIAALVRAVGFRALNAHLTCVTGFGAAAWDRLVGLPRPAGLHPFQELQAGSRHAVSTPGDLLFHIRATRLDSTGQIVDEVHGFSYFDERDLLGFVDGTENPTGAAAARAAIIGAEEPAYGGGSYVIVQRYVHDLAGWNALPVEEQEKIIGRTKLSDIELADSVKPTSAHNALNTIVVAGEEVDIVRDNMPFGEVGSGEYGTYFIGYARSSATTEQMLRNMFIGSPPGNYDRILDFSTAVTGSLFFVPSQTLLDSLADDDDGDETADDAPAQPEAAQPEAAQSATPARTVRTDGSLNIGSLRGDASR
jgi:porphyrinogen peroxidase